MVIALGMVSLLLLALALWSAAEERAVSTGEQRPADPTVERSAWELLGWDSFG